MSDQNGRSSVEQFEEQLKRRQEEQYVLKLYVAGTSERSIIAIDMVKNTCEKHLQGRYSLEVIDIYKHPQLARGDQIVAVPTLLKKLPEPLRATIGFIDQEERLLVGLDLCPSKLGGGLPT